MKIIKLHPKVNQQFIEIWYYTLDKWGTKQADIYVSSLERAIDNLAKGIKKGKVYELLPEEDIYYLVVEKHNIYYKEEKSYLFVLGIFHRAMDLPNRLIEILNEGIKL